MIDAAEFYARLEVPFPAPWRSCALLTCLPLQVTLKTTVI